MQEILAQVFSFVWGVWRHRWLALIVSWSVAIAGWAWVWQLPESYVATARVYVDTNSLLKPLLQGLTIQPNTQDRIGLLAESADATMPESSRRTVPVELISASCSNR